MYKIRIHTCSVFHVQRHGRELPYKLQTRHNFFFVSGRFCLFSFFTFWQNISIILVLFVRFVRWATKLPKYFYDFSCHFVTEMQRLSWNRDKWRGMPWIDCVCERVVDADCQMNLSSKRSRKHRENYLTLRWEPKNSNRKLNYRLYYSSRILFASDSHLDQVLEYRCWFMCMRKKTISSEINSNGNLDRNPMKEIEITRESRFEFNGINFVFFLFSLYSTLVTLKCIAPATGDWNAFFFSLFSLDLSEISALNQP